MTRSIPKRSFLVLSATRWTCSWSVIYIFAHGAGVGRQKKFFSLRGWKENFFTSILMGQSGNQKQDFFFLGHRIALPCCGYSLESHWRCVFNEYPQRVLWRNKQSYPLIVTKYPPYLFHFLCAQRRLRSAWASVQSDQRLRCLLSEQLKSQGFFMRTAKTLMPSPIWVFTGRIGHFAAALSHILEFINLNAVVEGRVCKKKNP